MKRRVFLTTAAATTGAILADHHGEKPASHDSIYLSLKDGMIGGKASVEDKYRLVKELGYDGVEIGVPKRANLEQAISASKNALRAWAFSNASSVLEATLNNCSSTGHAWL